VAADQTFKVGLLVIFAGGPIVNGVHIEDGSLLLGWVSIAQNQQNWTRGEKVTVPPK
jgi:hypothetical protein